MTTTDALLPCPFCGGEAHIGTVTYSRPLEDVTWDDGSPVLKAYYGHCAVCAVGHRNGIAGGYPTEQAAFAAWNRRAGQAHADAGLLAALERSTEGWANALELGLIPERHRNTAEILAEQGRAAIAAAKGAGGRDAG
jgi:hypothetical protein